LIHGKNSINVWGAKEILKEEGEEEERKESKKDLTEE
jgi:hypothetical protein